MTLVHLRDDAIAEAVRLARARGIIRAGDRGALDRLEGDALWVAKMRGRGRLRRALRRQICLIWRVLFEDADGRPVETRLVPLLVDVGGVSSHLSLQQLEEDLRPRVEAECAHWREDVVRVNGAFAAARSARERAVAAAALNRRAAVQSGLFDRRAERAQQDRALAVAAGERALSERRDEIVVASTLIGTPARLLLVLVP